MRLIIDGNPEDAPELVERMAREADKFDRPGWGRHWSVASGRVYFVRGTKTGVSAKLHQIEGHH